MLRHQNSTELFGYWNRIRADAEVPARASFDPTAIHRALPSVFILETATGPSTFRLAGTGVCHAHMRELRDFRFSSLWSDRDRRQADTVVSMIAREGGAAVLVSKAVTAAQETVEFETLLLPMLGRDGRRSLVIGTMSWLGRPWSLGSRPLGEHELSSMRMLPTRADEPTPGAADIIAFPGRPAGVHGRRVGHLTVVEGGAAS